ncbi:MAG: hypothetical protein N5P05_001772 [Chroococcopsis gigantea SAG 12.99]|nr:hypothetical protein [Chroococcopsis gigantea SAG 12.99]
MSDTALSRLQCETIRKNPSLEVFSLLDILKRNIWIVGSSSCGFGFIDRTIQSLVDNYLSVSELTQIFLTLFFLVSWLSLKPEIGPPREVTPDPKLGPNLLHLGIILDRMTGLKTQHLVSQSYLLPYSHLCQIYHLLNLKHLESVHNMTLNNLKVVNVNQFQSTMSGGVMKFQTAIESPLNALRIWRLPTVEVELTLHTPFTVELNIPAYNNKRIIILFNVVPLNNSEHKLFIDIYSDLSWYKPILQLILHLASLVTLLEDMPYLQTLAGRNIQGLIDNNRVSNHETMQLFKRFAELHQTRLEKPTLSTY